MFFKKKVKKPVYTDRVWLSHNAKINGLLTSLTTTYKDALMVMIITHFENSYLEIKNIFDYRNIKYKQFDSLYKTFTDCNPKNNDISNIYLIRSNEIPQSNDDTPFQISQSDRKFVFAVLEHYPNGTKDEIIAAFIESLPVEYDYHYFISLDQPLINKFGGERLIEMMKKLGMTENEELNHPYIAKAIENAMEKIQKTYKSDRQASSESEWFIYNEGN